MKLAFFKLQDDRPVTLARKITVVLSSLVLLGLIAIIDYTTGWEVSFGIFYFVPIWLMTWTFNRKVAALISLACALVWLAVDKASGTKYTNEWIHYWNAGVRLAYFLTFALLLSKVREQLQKSTAEVKQLSGLLPICASCKKIRDDNGYWEQLEKYISARSKAAFSHGICPDCVKKLYPEFSDQLLREQENYSNNSPG